MRHLAIREQADCLNQMLRGHYAYYDIAGNIRALQRVHRAVETLLAQNAEQRELARADLVEAIPADPRAVSVAATKLYLSLLGAASHRRAGKQLLTSVVREARYVLREPGRGRPSLATRWFCQEDEKSSCYTKDGGGPSGAAL
jgi:hypothetical protein